MYRIDLTLRIKNIHSIENNGYKQVLNGLDIYKGARTPFLNNENVLAHLQKANREVEIKAVKIEAPSTMFIYFEKITPIVNFKTDGGYYILGENLVVLKKLRDIDAETYPIINFYRKLPYSYLQIGSKLDFAEIKAVVEILKNTLMKTEPQLEIFIENNGTILFETSSNRYLFSSEKDTSLQIYQFEQSVNLLNLDGKNFDILDLRFNKPVVTLK